VIGSARIFAIIPDLESGDAADRARRIDGIVVAERQAGSVRAPPGAIGSVSARLIATGSVSARLIAIGSVRARLIAIGCVGRRPCGMPPAGHVVLVVTM
jgi:hypothetical protein